MLHWNKANWLTIQSSMTVSDKSEHSYATVKFVIQFQSYIIELKR